MNRNIVGLVYFNGILLCFISKKKKKQIVSEIIEANLE